MTIKEWENIQIICEGPTENHFVKNVLNPFFKTYLISLKPIIGDKKNSLEGNVSIDRILYHIKHAKTRIITTFVDFYGFKNADNLSADEIIEKIKEGSGKEHLIPYLQVHETEALWFSKPDIILNEMNAGEEQKNALDKIIKEFNNPEDINNKKITAPSKRLEQIFKGYNKITDGMRIAQATGLECMRDRCPRFNDWVNSIITKADQLRG